MGAAASWAWRPQCLVVLLGSAASAQMFCLLGRGCWVATAKPSVWRLAAMVFYSVVTCMNASRMTISCHVVERLVRTSCSLSLPWRQGGVKLLPHSRAPLIWLGISFPITFTFHLSEIFMC